MRIASIPIVILLPLILNAQIQLLNDEFENLNTLSTNWENITDTEQWGAEHLEAFDINSTIPNSLYMMPYTGTWFGNYRSNLLFKNISGDFIVTTEVTSLNRTLDNIPDLQYSLAGLMIREPREYQNGGPADWTPGGENYIFLACGNATGASGSGQFEVKNTINSNSSLQVTPVSTTTNVQIRMARVGPYIIVLYKLPGDSWTVHRRYTRGDFSYTIQMGFVVYTDWQNSSQYNFLFHNSNVLNAQTPNNPVNNPMFAPGIIGEFKYSRYSEVILPQSLAGVNLNSAQVSDAALLAFLGFDSEKHCPDFYHIESDVGSEIIVEASAALEITADNLINENASMYFSAGEAIELQEGFEVTLGANLEVEIEDCPL